MVTHLYALSGKDESVRYVGKTAGALKRRLQKHISVSRGGADFHVSRWIRSQDFCVSIDLIETVEGDGSAEEVNLISSLRELGVDLTNTTPGGDGNTSPNQATRDKIRASLLGRKLSDAHRASIAKGNLGKKMSPEWCAKMGDLHRGKIVSAETRARMSESAKGRRHSPETRAKISEIVKKRGSPSAETRAKSSKAQKGRIVSEETKAKMSAAAKKRKAREALEKL